MEHLDGNENTDDESEDGGEGQLIPLVEDPSILRIAEPEESSNDVSLNGSADLLDTSRPDLESVANQEDRTEGEVEFWDTCFRPLPKENEVIFSF